MTRNELKIITATLASNYKGFVVDTKEKFDFWFEGLKDLEYSICQKAIMKITMQEEYQPTIAKIRKTYLEVQGVTKLSVNDSLNLINKAVGYGRYRSTEAMKWLKEQDECSWNVLKAIGFTNYCNSDPNFTRNIVVKMYTEASNNMEKHLKLSAEFNSEINLIQNHTYQLSESE